MIVTVVCNIITMAQGCSASDVVPVSGRAVSQVSNSWSSSEWHEKSSSEVALVRQKKPRSVDCKYLQLDWGVYMPEFMKNYKIGGRTGPMFESMTVSRFIKSTYVLCTKWASARVLWGWLGCIPCQCALPGEASAASQSCTRNHIQGSTAF